MTTYRGIISICNKLGIAARYGTRAEAESFLEMMGGMPCVFIHYNPNVKARLGWEAYTLIFGGDDVARTTEAVVSRMFDLYNVFWYTRLTRQNGNVVGVVALRYRMRMYGQGGGGSTEPDALNFTMPNGGTITLTRTGSPTTVTLEYTLDGGATWTEWTENGTTRTLTLNAGQKVYIRNTSTSSTGFSTSASDYYQFAFSGIADSGGNITSLLNKDTTGVISSYSFNYLFAGSTLRTSPEISVSSIQAGGLDHIYYNCTSLTNAGNITCVVLGGNALNQAFRGCTSLVTAPSITATYASTSSCYGVFYLCTALETATDVVLTTLYNNTCAYMFYGCSSLNYIKVHFTTIASNSLSDWVSGVAAAGDFYCPASLTIPMGDSGIPSGWTRHDL